MIIGATISIIASFISHCTCAQEIYGDHNISSAASSSIEIVKLSAVPWPLRTDKQQHPMVLKYYLHDNVIVDIDAPLSTKYSHQSILLQHMETVLRNCCERMRSLARIFGTPIANWKVTFFLYFISKILHGTPSRNNRFSCRLPKVLVRSRP